MKRVVTMVLAIVAVAVVLVPALQVFAAPEFADDAFARVWNRQDRAVFFQYTGRSWTWGPENISEGVMESYAEGADGERMVQYYDKSRMEINDPSADPTDRFYVTNGLLPIEMITGRMQVGNESFEPRGQATITAVGDPGNFPTYNDLAPLYDRAGSSPSGDIDQPVTTLLESTGTVDRDGFEDFTEDPNTVLLSDPSGQTNYGIPRAFVDFQNQSGLVFENNIYSTAQVFDPLFVFGLPVSEPYWVQAVVGGDTVPVLFQVFERRVLTYNPANDPSFRVEMGNVGRHYYEWRYGEPPTEDPTNEPYPSPNQ